MRQAKTESKQVGPVRWQMGRLSEESRNGLASSEVKHRNQRKRHEENESVWFFQVVRNNQRLEPLSLYWSLSCYQGQFGSHCLDCRNFDLYHFSRSLVVQNNSGWKSNTTSSPLHLQSPRTAKKKPCKWRCNWLLINLNLTPKGK